MDGEGHVTRVSMRIVLLSTIALAILSLSLVYSSAANPLGPGWQIDLFCPNGGFGKDASPSDLFLGKRIVLFAYVTYNEMPVQSALVAFQVDNPQGSPVILTTQQTNATGFATTDFTITRDVYPTFPSRWTAVATVSPAQDTINDTMPFQIVPFPIGGLSLSIPYLTGEISAITLFVEILFASAIIVLAKFCKTIF